jgi:DNA (cytosine-5)-methyltransferase 1
MRSVWQVEIDPYCRKLLECHFPDAKQYEDVRAVGKHNLESVDVISGGFPCQDISNAGKRAGIDGERSGLWSEYARIIRELRPRYVVVENVAALLGRGMERVLGDLAAIGYDAEWQSIRASDIGAPHRRERIWIVSYPSSIRPIRHNGISQGQQHQREWKALRIFDALYNDVAYPNGARSDQQSRLPIQQWEGLSDAHRSSRSSINKELLDDSAKWGLPKSEYEPRGTEQVYSSSTVRTLTANAGWWATEPNVGRVAHGIPARVDRLKGLGNAIVPQIAEWIGRRIIANA